MIQRWRLLWGGALLLWLASPFYSQQIDDQLITLAYAWSLATEGLLRWNGSVVEGYSNFSQLALLAAGVRAGLDGALLSKGISAAGGLAVLAVADRAIPATAEGTLLFLALALWPPLAFWTLGGMETTLFAALVAGGWAAALRGRAGAAAGLLWLAAVTRPEGAAFWAAGIGWMWWERRDPAGRRAVIAAAGWTGAAMLLYQALRVAYFGAWLPTPVLVKGVGAAGGWAGGIDRLERLAEDLATAGAIAGAALIGFDLRGRWAAALLPLALCAGLALSTEPDWMGHGRLWGGGVAAAAAGAGICGAGRGLRGRTALLLAGLILPASLLDAPGRGAAGLHMRPIRPLASPLKNLRQSLEAPLWEDVRLLVEETGWGDEVWVEDVGLIGHIPGIRVRDLAGLTDREMAEVVAGWREPEITAGPPADPQTGRAVRRWLRTVTYSGQAPVTPPEWLEPELGWAGQRMLVDAARRARWQWSAPARQEPEPAQIAARWADLYRRFPSIGRIAQQHAMALIRSGDLNGAIRVAERIAAQAPADPLVGDLPADLLRMLLLPGVDGEGWGERDGRPERWLRLRLPAVPAGQPPEAQAALLESWLIVEGSGGGSWRWDCEKKGFSIGPGRIAIHLGPAPCDGTLEIRYPRAAPSSIRLASRPANSTP